LSHTPGTLEPVMIAHLDTLLTALYVELTDRIIPLLGLGRRRPGKLGLERHGGRVPPGLWARIIQRLLALNVAIWHNWRIGAPVKRSLIASEH
jgi:hypothetical protein